ncbi:uncharacterized protein OCT59_021173 [Rhizophagus irregularis]|uniref:Kelch-like protein 17 n=1 Tax=Rhizophagus irregularis (strain DAOM 197198w) TaxID=1432141 RepID=A0A015JYU7_RHIIW|nr:hypothetical protein RirG_181640 [Rhizophagus irregularis DAOM 197198w]UZO02694.1 hypothetical protein OCT59_021173 [Rhizophagus irregularis]
MVILNYRSPYLRRILSTNKKENDGTLVNIKLSNILPEIFQIILSYIYGGRLSLDDYDISDIIKILVAASELSLQELIPHLQSFLIKNGTNWMEQNFNLIYQTSFENDSFFGLQKFCINLTSKNPDKLFNSVNFSSMSEKLLISIIQDSNLKTSDVQIWEQVHCTNPGLSSDSSSYSNDDFNTLKNTLQKIIPFMGFTSREFLYNVFPYRKILPNELYIDLLKLFLNSDYRPNKKNRKVIDSKIITIQHVELITKWIDKLRITDEIKNSYDFKLIFRGSRDGFSPNKFHEICDNESGTVSIFKVKYSDEILGGYNPIEWKSDMGFGITNKSFIFFFKNKKNIEHILSRVKDENLAIRYWDNYGPSFGSGDLTIYGGYGGFRNESNFCSNGYNYCRKASYEKNIRVSDYTFSVEDYEVFQIIKN